MAFGKSKITSGVTIVEAGTLTPKAVDITPGGTASTTTSVVSSQTANRTITLPDADDTLMGKATTDVMTNKSFDADGTGNSITNIENADIKAGANIAVSKLAALTASRAVVSDGSGVLSPATTTAAEIEFVNGVTSAIQTQLNTGATNLSNHISDATDAHAGSAITNTPSGNLAATTVQGALNELQTDVDTRATSAALSAHESDTSTHGVATIAGLTEVQQFTNKDYDGGTASNTLRMTVPKNTKANLDALTRKEATIAYGTDTDKLYVDNGTDLIAVGNSAGAVNFITNNDGEAGTTGWATFADAAASRPVDGTGGSANVTWTTTSSSPLNGSNSFLFTKDAVNRQGQGVSYTFSIPLEFRGKALSMTLPYIVASGTFAAGTSSTDSDMIAYFYDVTNSKLVEPSSFKMLSNSTTVSDAVRAQVQFDTTCTSARLILYCASTSASAYTVKFDDIVVGPSNYAYGTPVTDWVSWTPTGSWVANTTYTGRKRRVGDSMEYDVKVLLAGAPTSAALSINLLETIDTTKLTDTTANTFDLGRLSILDSGTANLVGRVGIGSTATTVNCYVDNVSGTYGAPSNITQAVPMTWAVNDFLHATFSAPILGLSSSVQTSEQTDTRVVAANATGSATSLSSSVTTVVPTTIVKDTHGAWSAGLYTVPVAGFYTIYVNAQTAVSNTYFELGYTVDGGSYILLGGHRQTAALASMYASGSATAYFNQGQIIRIVGQQSGTGTMSTFTASINRVAGPNQIAANEYIGAKYRSTAGTSIPSGSGTVVDFPTKDFDTHGCVTTGAAWKFTAPISGKYQVSATTILSTSTGWAVTEELYLYVAKNGVADTYLDYANDLASASGIRRAMSGVTTIQLNAGDYVNVVIVQSSGSAITLNSTSGTNVVCVERVGM